MSNPRSIMAPSINYKELNATTPLKQEEKLNTPQQYLYSALQHDRNKNDFSFSNIAFTALLGAGILFFASQSKTVQSFFGTSSSPKPAPK